MHGKTSTLDDVPRTARAPVGERPAPGGAMTTTDERMTPDELRELFLFEHLNAEQLDWVCEHCDVLEFAPGRRLHRGRSGRLLLRPAHRRSY